MDLKKLAEPFAATDIEWRVSRSGTSRGNIFCIVLAYITARAIQKRLDDVCGPESWRNEEPHILAVNGKSAFAGGISIRIESGEWITKWDVCDPTNIEASKGGFSGAMKRAGAQWGIGRYLYYTKETFAETSETSADGWNYAKTKDNTIFWWKPPELPGWALPKEHEVSETELNDLKKEWKQKFTPSGSKQEMGNAFDRFCCSVIGDFPAMDHTCWTQDAIYWVSQRIESTTDPNGPDSDVPFAGADE